MQTRIEWVDIYKGFLIFLVVLGHAFQGIAADHTIVTNVDYNYILYFKYLIYSFHMPAFFIAGGFFAYNLFAKLNIEYFLHRFRRLMQPYFVWGFITALFMQIASRFTNNGLGLKNFIYSPIKPFSVFWFLYVYFLIFIVQSILTVIFKEKSNKVFFILAIFLFLINPLIPKIWVFKSIATYMIYYALGLFTLTFVTKYQNFFSKVMTLILWIVIFLILFEIYFIYVQKNNLQIVYYLNFLTAIAGSILFINLSIIVSNWHNWFSNMNDSFGKYSMQIYVIHLLPLACTRIFLLRIVHLNNLWLVSGIITIISLIFCGLIIKISKNLHLTKILFG